MGHIRLGRLPATKKWQQVVALLSRGASLEQIAGASAEAAEISLEHARRDPALLQSFWLLTQLPLAARERLKIASYRFCDEVGESGLMPPPQLPKRFGGIAQQRIHLGRAKVARAYLE